MVNEKDKDTKIDFLEQFITDAAKSSSISDLFQKTLTHLDGHFGQRFSFEFKIDYKHYSYFTKKFYANSREFLHVIPVDEQNWGRFYISTPERGKLSAGGEALLKKENFWTTFAVLLGSQIKLHQLSLNYEKELALNRSIALVSRAVLSSFNLKQIATIVLQTAKEITSSPLGFVGYIDEETGALVCPALDSSAWRGEKKVEMPLVFDRFSGLWGWALKHKRSILTNEAEKDPRSVKPPKEHLPITRFLASPCIADNELLGIIAVANSVNEYTKDDQNQLESLADMLAEALRKIKIDTQLRESEEKYRTLFEHSIEPIYTSTFDGKLLEMNQASVEMLGYKSIKELQDLDNLEQFYVYPEERKELLLNLEDKGFVKDFEIHLRRKDGKVLTVLCTAYSEKIKGKQVIRGFLKDITQRVEHEEKLKKVNEELTRSYRLLQETQAQMIQQEKLASIGQLAAGIAHEINNPLGFISSNYQSLKRYFENVKSFLDKVLNQKDLLVTNGNIENREIKKIQFILDDIGNIFKESQEGFDRILNIVQNLKNFSRIDFTQKADYYDINSAIESTLIVARNEIKYVADVETRLGKIANFKCLGSEINQVLLNIIVNAAQAIGSQNRTDRGKIIIETFEENGWVVCKISDDGPGIPKKYLDKIFDPFFTTKAPGKGTGLGLYIAYDIVVNKHQGKLEVETEPGKGTTFIIRLPIDSPVFKDTEGVAEDE